MRTEPEEIDLATYRRLTGGKRRQKKARPDIPRAPRDEPTGLTALIVAGWCVESTDNIRHRLYQPGGPDTGMCASLKGACDKAKELSR